jgi:hypothetical protein
MQNGAHVTVPPLKSEGLLVGCVIIRMVGIVANTAPPFGMGFAQSCESTVPPPPPAANARTFVNFDLQNAQHRVNFHTFSIETIEVFQRSSTYRWRG